MKAEMEAIKRQMEGIIAPLLALALVAERACGAPLSVRAKVLSLLWPAEQVARGYVFRALGPAVLLPSHDGETVADAQELALRFRLLAFALMGVAARLVAAWRLDEAPRPSGKARDAGGGFGNARVVAVLVPRPFDTS